MATKYRVEIEEADSEVKRGFISVDDDDNPNSTTKVREFDDIYEAKQAIKKTIATDRIGMREFAFMILDDDGLVLWTTYYDEVYKHWDAFEG